MGFRFHSIRTVYRTHISRQTSRQAYTNLGHSAILGPPGRHRQGPSFSSVFSINPSYSIPRRWHLGHFHGSHDDDRQHRHHHHDFHGKEGERIFRLGLAADIGLATGKALTGYLSGSTAIVADAAHSLSDVVLSGVALLSFKAGKTPKDKEHPYGHGKFETLGALGISCMLLVTAGGIAWHAIELLMGLISAAPGMINHSLTHEHMHGHHHDGHHHGIDMAHPILALSMTVTSIAVKEGLFWITKRAGERQGSRLMKANAWHHRADAISSVVALIGVGGSILGVKFLDPLAGLVVSGMILKAGLENGYQSVLELVDAAIPVQELEPIRQTILQVEGVDGCHQLRGRRAGSSLYLDVHIEVDPFSSVSAAHEIGESVRRQIHNSHPEVAEVFIHIDPATSQLTDNAVDRQKCLNETLCHQAIPSLGEKDVEVAISTMKFPEEVSVERITHHVLHGKFILQVQVSMPEDMMIRDAMEVANKAEKELLKAAPNIMQVCIQLRLGQSFPEYSKEASKDVHF